MINNSYTDDYQRIKGTGARPAVRFFKPVPKKEEYLPILDIHIKNICPGRYFVSNYGNVYDAVKKAPVSQKPDKDGYLTCSIICTDRYMKMKVHRLVLMVFEYIDNFKNYEVNHIDGIPYNNIISNLEWCTGKQNTDHSMIYGLHKMNGSLNPNSKLTEYDVHKICQLIETGNYYDTEIAKMFDVSYTNISDIHNGKIWTNISCNYDLSKRKSRKKQ